MVIECQDIERNLPKRPPSSLIPASVAMPRISQLVHNPTFAGPKVCVFSRGKSQGAMQRTSSLSRRVFPTRVGHFFTSTFMTTGSVVSQRVKVQQRSDPSPVWPDIIRTCHHDGRYRYWSGRVEMWWKLLQGGDARVDRAT